MSVSAWSLIVLSYFLNSSSIRTKLIVATAPSLLALLVFASMFGWGQIQKGREMSQVVQLASFTESVGNLVHELQKERGRTAGFVGSGGASAQANAYKQQQTQTDFALAEFRQSSKGAESIFQTKSQKDHFNQVSRLLESLERHRTRVDSLQLGLNASVGEYTSMVDALIVLVHDELTLLNNSDLAVDMQGLVTLMRAKEASGLERAQGNAIFASGTITLDRHQVILALISEQKAYFDEFIQTMPKSWREQLSTFQNGEEFSKVDSAREVLIAAGYGSPLAGYTSEEWFNITTARIDALKQIADKLVHEIEANAEDIKSQTDLSVILVLAAAAIVVIPSIILSILLVNSIVGPMKGITSALDKLAKGATDVEISGRERGDEIGVLARAAQEFLRMSKQREQLIQERTAHEHEALLERRKVLAQMAREVEDATQSTVNQIVAAAEELAATATTMQGTLATASRNADDASSATSDSLDGTNRASELASELNAAIGEVTSSIVKGDQLARDTVQVAAESRACVEELNEATQQIGDFVRVITELADQTNLLALNATIESARAGEHGKGFAVVATEIKQLASQTNRSANEITERVTQIQDRTQTAVDAINKISVSVNMLGGVTSSVAAAVEEQRVSTDSFAQFLHSNRSSIQDVANRVSELVAITRQTADGAVEIAGRVSNMAQTSRDASKSIPQIVQRAVAAADNRKEPRQDIYSPAQIVGDGAPISTIIKDVSKSGARVGRATEGSFELDLPGHLGKVSAQTAWSNDRESGVQFKEPLTSNIMEQLLAMHKKSDVA